MIALDASVVIAILDHADRHHDRAEGLLARHAASGFLMHSITVAEVLVAAVRAGEGNQRMIELAAMGIEVVDPSALEPLALAELRVSTRLPLPDCCVLSVGLWSSVPIATFDVALARAAESLGLELAN